MGLKDAMPVMKCKAFYLSLSGAAKVWYTRLEAKIIRSWPNFKKAFLKRFAMCKEDEGQIQ